MIFTERTIRIVNGLCEIDNPIILYRGDFNVEIRFTIIDCPYKYTTKDSSNVIETTNASYGQLVIKTPNGDPIFSDVTATNEGAVVFTITGDMIDETIELGDYDFQIRLFDSERTSRATICPVVSGIKVEEPIAIEGGSTVVSDTNEVNVARANYAVTTTSAALEAFDSQGNYIETTWSDKMLITDARLNKIEDGITGVNQKIANINIPTVPTKTSQLTNDSDFATNASVDEKIANASLGGGGGEVDLSAYQTKTDNTLTTTDKTVVGAINEMNEAMVIAEEQTGDVTVGGLPIGGSAVALRDITNGECFVFLNQDNPDGETPGGGDTGGEDTGGGDTGGGDTNEIVSTGLIKRLDEITSTQTIDNSDNTYFDINNSNFTVFAKCTVVTDSTNYATVLGGSKHPLTMQIAWNGGIGLTLEAIKGGSAIYPVISNAAINKEAYDQAGETVFIAFVGDGSKITCYINNVATGAAASYVDVTFTPPTSVTVGGKDKKVTWLYYNRALTSEELTQNYTVLGGVS